MLSVIVIASFILPSVLGGCCMPDKMSATVHIAGNQEGSDFVLVDTSQNKYIVRPDFGDIEFILTDESEGTEYTKFRDGSCISAPMRWPLDHCVPENVTSGGFESLGGVDVQAFNYIKYEVGGEETPTTFVMTKECLPVMVITNRQVLWTRVYTNVDLTVTDFSDLDQDVSNCEEQEEEV